MVTFFFYSTNGNRLFKGQRGFLQWIFTVIFFFLQCCLLLKRHYHSSSLLGSFVLWLCLWISEQCRCEMDGSERAEFERATNLILFIMR